MATKLYEYYFLPKYILGEPQTLDDIISALRAEANGLAEMKAAGVAFDPESCDASDGHVTLTTTDPKVAERYGFETFEDDDDEDFEDDEELIDEDEEGADDGGD